VNGGTGFRKRHDATNGLPVETRLGLATKNDEGGIRIWILEIGPPFHQFPDAVANLVQRFRGFSANEGLHRRSIE